MKNVLLPTDLTVQSLRPVHNIVKGANGQPVRVHIVHLMCPSTSITDLLFINQSKPWNQVPANFRESLELLRNKYQGVVSIVFDFVYCTTSRYFNNLIEGKKIDEVYMLGNYKYKSTLDQSEDPVPHINKCNVTVHRLAVNEEETSEYMNLSSLLNGNQQNKEQELNKAGKRAMSYS